MCYHLTTPPGKTAPPVPNTCPLQLCEDRCCAALSVPHVHAAAEAGLRAGQDAASGSEGGSAKVFHPAVPLKLELHGKLPVCPAMWCRLCHMVTSLQAATAAAAADGKVSEHIFSPWTTMTQSAFHSDFNIHVGLDFSKKMIFRVSN